jgi:hypothetical protein
VQSLGSVNRDDGDRGPQHARRGGGVQDPRSTYRESVGLRRCSSTPAIASSKATATSLPSANVSCVTALSEGTWAPARSESPYTTTRPLTRRLSLPVGTVATVRIAARPPSCEIRGGEDEQTGDRIGVAVLTGRQRLRVRREDLAQMGIVISQVRPGFLQCVRTESNPQPSDP